MSKADDLTGKRFGRLVVIERAGLHITSGGQRKTLWKCQCDCGKDVITNAQRLKMGETLSCGCYKRQRTSEVKLHNLTGKRFGRLTVLCRTESKSQSTKWKCQCDCGNTCVVLAGNLVKGHTTSCGCYREETRGLKHGYRHDRIYSVWEKLKSRCCNPKNPSYARYGGRGIEICEEWKNNPESFIKWAYENGYRSDASYGECTIERIDNNKGYSPENCIIANEKEQANNRRSNRLITHNGETKTLAQWRDFFGMTQSKAYYHLVEKNRSIQELLDKGVI